MITNIRWIQKAIMIAAVCAVTEGARASLVQISPGQSIANSSGASINGSTLSTISSSSGLNAGLYQILDYTAAYTSYSALHPGTITDNGTITTEVFRVGSNTLGAPLLFEYIVHNTDNDVNISTNSTRIAHNMTNAVTHIVTTTYTTNYTYVTNRVTGGPETAGLTFYQASYDAVGFGTTNVTSVQDNIPQDNALTIMFGGTDGELGAGSTASFYVYTTDPYTQLGAASFLNGVSIGASSEYAALPEPGTIVSGALLVLPLGASALRILRKKALSSKV